MSKSGKSLEKEVERLTKMDKINLTLGLLALCISTGSFARTEWGAVQDKKQREFKLKGRLYNLASEINGLEVSRSNKQRGDKALAILAAKERKDPSLRNSDSHVQTREVIAIFEGNFGRDNVIARTLASDLGLVANENWDILIRNSPVDEKYNLLERTLAQRVRDVYGEPYFDLFDLTYDYRAAAGKFVATYNASRTIPADQYRLFHEIGIRGTKLGVPETWTASMTSREFDYASEQWNYQLQKIVFETPPRFEYVETIEQPE